MLERTIEGFDLRCDIVLRDDGTYHIVVCSRSSGSEEAERRWEIPIHPPIRTLEAAERHAKYVMAGIQAMHDVHGPAYTVI